MKEKFKKKWYFIIIPAVIVVFALTIIISDKVKKGNLDAVFKKYIKDNYGITVNDNNYVKRCYANCDYYGFYNAGTDYNYMIQITIKDDKIETHIDKDVMEAREKLLKYIERLHGSDFASNYLGYYRNAYSGPVRSSTTEMYGLYYIIKYRSGMNIDEELYKDYQILQASVKMLPKFFPRSMQVKYIEDERLSGSDWVTKLGIGIEDYSTIIDRTSSKGFGGQLLNEPKFEYSLSSSYDDNENSLASLSFEEFKRQAYAEMNK